MCCVCLAKDGEKLRWEHLTVEGFSVGVRGVEWTTVGRLVLCGFSGCVDCLPFCECECHVSDVEQHERGEVECRGMLEKVRGCLGLSVNGGGERIVREFVGWEWEVCYEWEHVCVSRVSGDR